MGSLQKYHFDFIFHGVEYGVLGALLFRAMFFSFERMPKWELFASVILLGVLYGVSDEWHQSFVPMRKPDFFDLLADSIGVVLGSVLYARSKSVQRSSV